ncbi:hypothetical protein, variant [Aphanomyces invadans]|uniref:Uncharacterized protein n=1 Tax=Aphanomyces invadans TaxID=157072 RepID=A0A024UEY6_9STRA|nr:hypothetical protein, variant [Aphanomyces invadans]ETW04780.1 hypothetical protein, variant [Aphanomyces invadans]|eukprot:XP_008866217.1 hypothetical protein, variant [Aphanomyces invadans]
MSNSPPPTVLRGWEWTQHALWREDVKCNVRMVDTVFFDQQTNRPSRWLFASKHGTISKKKDDHLTYDSIRDRFLRLSAHPQNTNKFVAYCLYRNGNRKLLNAAQFDDLINALDAPRASSKAPSILGFQGYVVGRTDPPITLVATVKSGQCVVVAVHQHTGEGIDHVVSLRLRKEVEQATTDITQFLRQAAHVAVVKLTAEFVEADENVLWLVHVPNAAVQSDDVDNAGAELQQSQSLPSLKLASDGAPKCRGDFCSVPTTALPGLFPLSPPSPPVLDDTRERSKIGNHHVLLGRLGMKYLQVGPPSGGDIAVEWAAMDSTQRAELGRSNPGTFYKQVHVCPNCNRVYTHLQALRETQFRHRSVDGIDNDREDDQQRPPSSKRVGKARKARPAGFPAKGGPPLMGNNNIKPSEDLMRFMGMTAHNPLATAPTLDSLQDQQHEAAFLAELAKHSTPQEGSPRNSPPEDEVDNVPLPAIAKEPLTRSFTKKSSKKDHRSNHQPVLAQFEHEWNQVDHANRSLMQENQALRDRLHQIETQMTSESRRLKQELTTALESNTVLEKQSKQLGKRIASMQKEFADAMAEKDDMVRRQLVEADQRYNQQLLERLANTGNGSGAAAMGPSTRDKGGDQLSLIETIEHLTGQLEKEQRDHELDAHKMQAQHQDDVARIYDRHKMETEALRISVRQGVDAIDELKTQLFALQNQLQVAHSQNKQAKATLHDVQHQKIDLEEQVVTLEKKLQASVSSADARAAAATDQASLEKLQHKIDYLKAQLASEIRCKEELGSNVATLTVNIDALKKDRKKILVEADDSHRKMLERVEERHQQELDMVNSQNASLQSKIVQLQANVTDLVGDLSAARNKEENAKLTTEKLAQEAVRLNSRIAELELQNEELQESINGTKSSMDDAARANLEATLRRLTHERQYLKNQMDGECRVKEEAEAKCKELQAQLTEAQNAWKQEVTTVKLAAKDREQALQSQLAKGEDTNLVVQGELTSAKHQLNEAKLALFKTREQAHNDQTALESCRSDLAHMKANLICAKEELVKERERSRVASDRQTKAIATIKASLIQLEADKGQAIAAIQAELQATVTKLATAQASIVQLEDAAVLQANAHRRALALHSVVNSTAARDTLRLHKRWWKWVAHWQALRALQTQGVKVAETLKAREAKWHERLEATCDDLNKKSQLEKEMAVAELTNLHAAALYEARSHLEQQHADAMSALEAHLRTQSDNAIRELTAQHSEEIDSLEAQHAHTIQLLQEAAQSNEARAEAALADLKQSSDQRERQLRAESSTLLTQSMREMEMAHQNELQRLHNEAHDKFLLVEKLKRDELTAVVAAADATCLEQLRQADERQRMAASDRDSSWIVQCRARVAFECDKLAAAHREAVQSLKAHHSHEVTELIEQWTNRLEEERTAHSNALHELRQVLEGKVAAEVEACRRDMLEQKGTAVLTTTAKWQRALADTNARLEVEKKVAYDKGVADREAEWQRAALLIKEAQKEEMSQLERDSREALRACEEKFQLSLTTKTAQLQKACNDSIAAQEAAAQVALNEAVARTRETVERETTRIVEDAWREKMLAQRVELEDALLKACHEAEARALQLSLEKHQAAFAQWERSKAADLATMQASLQEQFAQHTYESLEQHRREKETAMQAISDEWAVKLATEVERLRTEANVRMQAEIHACAEASAKQHEGQMALVQEESEKLIEKVESAMTQLKRQKESIEQELKSVQQALEEAEDASFDLQEELTALKKLHVFHHVMLLNSGMRKIQHLEDEIDSKDMEARAHVAEWQQKFEATTRDMNERLDRAQAANTKLELVYGNVYDTLVNYKRDELVAHRSASNVVTSELGVLQAQIAEVIKTKSDGENDVQSALTELGTLEEEIGSIQLMKEGHVNQAQVARKRRLHHEMEAMLETIETKRTRVRRTPGFT